MEYRSETLTDLGGYESKKLIDAAHLTTTPEPSFETRRRAASSV